MEPNMDETPIFTQLSKELCPEWYLPVPVEEVVINGNMVYRLSLAAKDIWVTQKPPWL